MALLGNKVDWTKTNAALQRLNQMLGYNWLDKMRTERDVEEFDRRMGMYEEQDIAKTGRDFQLHVQKAGVDLEKALKEGLMKAAGEDNQYLFHLKQAQLYESTGRADQAKAEYAEAMKRAQPFIDIASKPVEDLWDPKVIEAVLGTMSPDKTLEIMRESSVAKRAGVTAGLEETRLGLEKKKLGLAREEFQAEQKPGGKTTDYYKAIHDKVTGVQSYLRGLNSALKTGDVGLEELEMDSTLQNLVGGAITPEKLAKLLARISSLDTKAMRGPLTPQEEAEIDNAYDIFNAQVEPRSMVSPQIKRTVSPSTTTTPLTISSEPPPPTPSPAGNTVARFQAVVRILVANGLTQEQAVALARTDQEFAGIK